MAEEVAARSRGSAVSDAVRAALAMVGVLGVLAVTFGLYVLGTSRDQTVQDASVETQLLTSLLLQDAAQLQGREGAAVLARAVLTTDRVRAATVWLGDDSRVLAVGPSAPSPGSEDIDEAVRTGEPVVEQRDGAIEVTTAFARVEGEPVVLVTRTPLTPPGLGWTGIGIAWLVLSVSIVTASLLLERRRQDRVMTLQDTVQALYAHDTQVTRQQQDLLRSKTGFVNAISQELRSPLQVIKGIANLLATGGELSARQRRDLVDGLRLNADRLDVLVGDLIDVDRLTQRTVAVSRRPIRIDAALEAALQDIDLSQHELHADVGDVVASATPAHVERILRCLLHNASKYAPAGSTIEVRAVRDGEAVVLAVDDQGPGIPSGDRVAVFEPLHQLADDSGMGLGLALVKRFAELHGGRAWVEASPAGGAAVRVVLPDEGDPVTIDTWRVAGANVDSEHSSPVGAP